METGSQVWLTDWRSQETLRSNVSKIVKCSASVRGGFTSSASLTHQVPVPPRGGGAGSLFPGARISQPGYSDDSLLPPPNLNPSALAVNLWPWAAQLCTRATKFYQRRDDAADCGSQLDWKLWCPSGSVQGRHVWMHGLLEDKSFES